MASCDVATVLNDLLSLELCGIPIRMIESVPFISGAAAVDDAELHKMVGQCREHIGWLTEAILAAGGAPRPRPVADTAGAGLHFQELHSALPQLLDDRRLVLQRFRDAGSAITDKAATETVARVVGRLEAQVVTLEALSENTVTSAD